MFFFLLLTNILLYIQITIYGICDVEDGDDNDENWVFFPFVDNKLLIDCDAPRLLCHKKSPRDIKVNFFSSVYLVIK